jgi:hypothetical protein
MMSQRGLMCGSVVVLLVATVFGVRAESSQAKPVAVNIVPTSSDERTGHAIELFSGSHFHVVVENLSSAPIKLWKEWCSWGYFNLSFEARDSSGRSFVISKRNRGWDKNFPCPIVIDAGRSWVIDVNLDPSIWQNSPLSSDTGKATLRLKEDERSKSEKVWTGKVSSPEAEYTFYWVGAAAKATLRRLPNARP